LVEVLQFPYNTHYSYKYIQHFQFPSGFEFPMEKCSAITKWNTSYITAYLDNQSHSNIKNKFEPTAGL